MSKDFTGIIEMMDNYKDRKVSRFDGKYHDEDFIVDTCAVSDSDKPFETGVQHPAYNNNEWVIVEMYDTKEAAKSGHNKWVRMMTAKILPRSLNDVSTCFLCEFMDTLDKNWRKRNVGKTRPD